MMLKQEPFKGKQEPMNHKQEQMKGKQGLMMGKQEQMMFKVVLRQGKMAVLIYGDRRETGDGRPPTAKSQKLAAKSQLLKAS